MSSYQLSLSLFINCETHIFQGEIALLAPHKQRQATVTASGTLKCFTLNRNVFNRVMGPLQESPRLCFFIIRIHVFNMKFVFTTTILTKVISPLFHNCGNAHLPGYLDEKYG